MTKTEPRSAGSGGGREKTTPTELLAHWRVSVEANGVTLVAIESDGHLAGCVIGEQDEQVIRKCAQHLLAFLGDTTLSAREDGWQPIESTLPNDDDHVLVCWHDGSMAIAYYVSERGWFDADCSDEYDFAPTYWRKLPELPKAPTAGEGRED